MLKDKLQSIFSDDYPGYYKFADEVVRPIFGKDFERYPMPVPMEIGQSAINANIQTINRIGIINDNDNRGRNPIEVFDVTINDNAEITRSRVNIQTWIRSELGLYTHAFIIFHYANPDGRSWRLSYLYKPDTIRGATEAKRYTYLLGKSFSARTITENFVKLASSSLDDKALGEAFSVQALSDDFFKEYRQLYADIIEYITGKVTKKINNKWQEVPSIKNGPNKIIMAAFKDNEQRVRDYIKKMMGRLTFMYFIQRKGWLCKKQNFMHELFFTSDKQDSFLDDVLEPLFFGVLNTGENREAVFAQNGWDMSLLEHWKDIKYLNGGLFEQTDDDRLECKLPKSCFENIFNFFDRYNFTIDENDPSDAEIGIDPEMLGRIFESLLEDNKDKGSFYTPKEIVQYMCKTSLRQYLLTRTTGAELVITALVDNHNIETDDLTLVQSLDEHLKAVKICDPAIGSGAFPMGLLNEILTCRRLIHNYLHREDNVEFNALAVKREIIRNNIFGVDIEQGAVDIARLRFWLSIVVDTDEPEPLPNLDYTIVRGNSLITTFQGEHLNLSNDVDRRTRLGRELQQLFKLQEKIYDQYGDPELQTAIDIKLKLLDIITIQLGLEQSDAKSIINKTEDTLFDAANSRSKKKNLEAKKLMERKGRAKASIEKLRIALQSTTQSLIKRAQTDIDFFDWNIMFSDIFATGGFDIVIGNPPYGVSIKDDYRIDVVSRWGNVPDYEIYYYFMELGYALLNQSGIQCYIIPNTYLFNVYAANYRRAVLDRWNVLEILDCTKFPIFESAVVRNTINTWQRSNRISDMVGYRNTSGVKSFDALIARRLESISKENLLEMNQNWGLAFSLAPDVISVVCKISEKISLEHYFNEISQGLIAYDKYQGQTEEIIKNRAYHFSDYKPGLKFWLWGEDIRRYSVKWNKSEYINYCDGIANPRQPKFFIGKRLLVREITNPSIFAAITEDEYYNDPAIIIIRDSNKYSLSSCLAILNSKLATFFHFNHSPKATKGAFPKILVQDIKDFPLPNIAPEMVERLEQLVAQITTLKSEDSNADTLTFENEIDKIVYHLYELTYDEVLIIDPSTPISREEYENNSV